MRIQLICAAFPPFGRGGGPASSELIALALVSRGHEVEVLTASDKPYHAAGNGYRVCSIGSPNIYADYWRDNPSWKKVIWHLLENFNPRAFLRVWREMRRFQPDVVMTVSIENVNVATWVVAKLRGLPVIHVIHSCFVLCWRGIMLRGEASCSGYCRGCHLTSIGKRLSAKCVDAIIGESEFIINAHRKHSVFANARRYVIPAPMGADDAVRADDVCLPRVPRRLSIGYIGNITHGKGVLTLARAANRLVQEYDGEVRFRIAGTGKESFLEEVRSQFPAGLTEFVGWTTPESFYPTVDVVVVPSLMDEPFGRVSIEPLAYGIPVVVARSGGLPENVEDGVSGLIFDRDDDAQLASILMELARNPARLRELSKGARSRANLYSFAKCAAALDDVVSQLRRVSRTGALAPVENPQR